MARFGRKLEDSGINFAAKDLEGLPDSGLSLSEDDLVKIGNQDNKFEL